MLKRGVTLVEVLISFAIFIITIGVVYFSLITFSKTLKERYVYTCLTEVAYSVAQNCEAGFNPPPNLRCGKITVNISTNDSCQVEESNCKDVTITTRFKSYQPFHLTVKVCNFGG